MSRNWLRAWSVEVGGITVNPELRVRFIAKQRTLQSPATLELTVTNVKYSTAHALRSMVGKTIRLSAGYQDNIGLLFSGTVAKVLAQVRENPTDTAVTFWASAGQLAYRYGHVNKTLKGGATGLDVYNTLLEALKPFGIVRGNIPAEALKKIQFPRAHVLYGDVKRHMRKLAQDVNGQFHIGNTGDLNITPADSQGSGQVVKINVTTGMIGLPIEQEIGIIVTFLINPEVHLNGLVKINNSDIQEGAARLVFTEEGSGAIDPSQSSAFQNLRADDGIYKVVGLTWFGDSRGENWYGTAILNNPKLAQPLASSVGLGGVAPISGDESAAHPPPPPLTFK
jgi:hypothetical protein